MAPYDVFESDDDMFRIKEDIALSLSKTDCYLHAYVIMTNHLHLLITTKDKSQLASFMQSMENRYVRYFNAGRKRTGTIWEGRFKSCLVDSDRYLFTLYKYIEMNPVKAEMVKAASDYQWSSYRRNAIGQKDGLISEHESFIALSKDAKQRCKRYKAIFDEPNTEKQEQKITQATMRGEVYGSDGFHRKVSGLLSRVIRLSSHGEDRKSEAYNQAG